MNEGESSNRAQARDAFEKRIGHVFATRSLLAQALTHRSAGANHNERLEFLGDGILNFVIAAALFEQNPTLPEGDLSRLRAALVRETTLAEIAGELELSALLVLGPGETRTGSRRRDSIKADAVEAVLGAIYCDAGFAATRQVILGLYRQRLMDLPTADSVKDAKTRLQEWLQARGRARPVYEIVAISGPEHAQQFVARCRLEDDEALEAAQGQGSGRRKAEQDAARRMLYTLETQAG